MRAEQRPRPAAQPSARRHQPPDFLPSSLDSEPQVISDDAKIRPLEHFPLGWWKFPHDTLTRAWPLLEPVLIPDAFSAIALVAQNRAHPPGFPTPRLLLVQPPDNGVHTEPLGVPFEYFADVPRLGFVNHKAPGRAAPDTRSRPRARWGPGSARCDSRTSSPQSRTRVPPGRPASAGPWRPSRAGTDRPRARARLSTLSLLRDRIDPARPAGGTTPAARRSHGIAGEIPRLNVAVSYS
jgi:hypothetical protein